MVGAPISILGRLAHSDAASLCSVSNSSDGGSRVPTTSTTWRGCRPSASPGAPAAAAAASTCTLLLSQLLTYISPWSVAHKSCSLPTVLVGMPGSLSATTHSPPPPADAGWYVAASDAVSDQSKMVMAPARVGGHHCLGRNGTGGSTTNVRMSGSSKQYLPHSMLPLLLEMHTRPTRARPAPQKTTVRNPPTTHRTRTWRAQRT